MIYIIIFFQLVATMKVMAQLNSETYVFITYEFDFKFIYFVINAFNEDFSVAECSLLQFYHSLVRI